MDRPTSHTSAIGASLLALTTFAPLALAQSIAMPWSTLDFGGASMSGSSLTLCATIGQSDAGPPLAGASLQLAGGYWCPGIDATCPADLDDDGSFPTGAHPDGGVTIDDLIYFLAGFELGHLSVDLDDDGAEPRQPDGGITIDDLIYFMRHFELGC